MAFFVVVWDLGWPGASGKAGVDYNPMEMRARDNVCVPFRMFLC